MTQTKSATRATVTGGTAMRALSIGAFALGTGAIVVGAISIGRLRILEARIETLSTQGGPSKRALPMSSCSSAGGMSCGKI